MYVVQSSDIDFCNDISLSAKKPSTNGSVVKFSILLCLCSDLSSTESGYMKKVKYKLAKGKC